MAGTSVRHPAAAEGFKPNGVMTTLLQRMRTHRLPHATRHNYGCGHPSFPWSSNGMRMNPLKSPAVRLGLVAALIVGTGVACGNSSGPELTGGIRVLFVGNSLTYVNDLPRTLSDMALTVGDTIQVRSVSRSEERRVGKEWRSRW